MRTIMTAILTAGLFGGFLPPDAGAFATAFQKDREAPDADDPPVEEEKDPREVKKEVEAMARKFRRDFNAAKSDGAKAELVRELAKTKHSVVAGELVNLLRLSLTRTRLAAAEALSAYHNEPKIADTMLKYAAAIDSDEVVIAVLDAVAKIAACRGMGRLGVLFEKSDRIVIKAIEVAGKVRSRLSVLPLVGLLHELEEIKPIYDLPEIDPVRGRDNTRRRITNQDQLDRKEKLVPRVKEALHQIIGQKFSSAAKYRAWWKANASRFADPEDERLLEEKKKK